MFGLFNKSSKSSANWDTIEDISELDEAVKSSYNQPIVLFKHSTTCSISSMAKSRLEYSNNEESPKIYYLDLLAHRNISNEIADRLKVRHESPQVIIVKNGGVLYHASHGAINMNDLVLNTK
jgi:bacillithiol system protein YtxJ